MKQQRLLLGVATFLFATFLFSAAAFASGPLSIIVLGQDDAVVDRQAIQDAIDAARPRDTVELRGTFQLDGTSIKISTSRLTVTGEAIDNDGDGVANEDWADGIDNDADGAIDEDGWDTVLVGVDDGAGGPARDAFPNRFNDGFEILGLSSTVRDVTIRDIKFTRVNRGVYVFPDYDDNGTVLVCDSSVATLGSARRIEVRRNFFENGSRGVEILGRVRSLSIEKNVFLGVSGPVLMFGQNIGCAETDGSLVEFLPLETPSRTRIKDNQILEGNIGVFSQVTSRTSVLNNQFRDTGLGVLSLEDKQLTAMHNDIAGSFVALFGSFDPRVDGPASGNFFAYNTISNAFFGMIVDCETTGYIGVNNEFIGSFASDVLLDGTAPGGECEAFGLGDSFGNIIVASQFPTVVMDFGMNRVIGGMVTASGLASRSEFQKGLQSQTRGDWIKEQLAAFARP